MWMIVAALFFLLCNSGITRAGSYCNGLYSYVSYDYCYDTYDEVDVGAIVGGVVGGLAGLGVLITAIIFICACISKKNRTGPRIVMQTNPNVAIAHTSSAYPNQMMAYPQTSGYAQQGYGYSQQPGLLQQQGYQQQHSHPQQQYHSQVVEQHPLGVQEVKQPPTV